MRSRGYVCDVHFIDQGDPGSLRSRRSIKTLPRQFIKLLMLMWCERPDCIISLTPKAGFLCSIVSLIFWCRHIHWYTGQVWCNDTGLKRILRSLPDRITNFLSTEQLVDSKPQLKYLNDAKFLSTKMRTLGMGSITGVHPILNTKILKKFDNKRIKVGFVGRICMDKGINDILDFIEKKGSKLEMFEFLFFGYFEDGEQPLQDRFFKLVEKYPKRIQYCGVKKQKNEIYNNIDMLCLPSYREGFSNVLIEAQSYGKPVIVRDIYAVKDSFMEGITGYSFKDHEMLYAMLLKLVDVDVYKAFSQASVKYIDDNFNRDKVLNMICAQYEKNNK